ncbi:Uncharacterised protein [uncultured archaeon]|nr:Uncharacterised protein [uncultured archaeon]
MIPLSIVVVIGVLCFAFGGLIAYAIALRERARLDHEILEVVKGTDAALVFVGNYLGRMDRYMSTLAHDWEEATREDFGKGATNQPPPGAPPTTAVNKGKKSVPPPPPPPDKPITKGL